MVFHFLPSLQAVFEQFGVWMFCWVVATQTFFLLHTPKIGEDEPIWTIIFQMGWFNHQLVLVDVSKVVSLLHLVDKPWKTSDVGVDWLMFFVDVSYSIVTLCYDVQGWLGIPADVIPKKISTSMTSVVSTHWTGTHPYQQAIFWHSFHSWRTLGVARGAFWGCLRDFLGMLIGVTKWQPF